MRSNGITTYVTSLSYSRSVRNAVVSVSGHGDGDAFAVVDGPSFAGDDDRTVVVAHARPVRQEKVLVRQMRVGVERDRGHLVGARERRAIQRLDVAEQMFDLEAAQSGTWPLARP